MTPLRRDPTDPLSHSHQLMAAITVVTVDPLPLIMALSTADLNKDLITVDLNKDLITVDLNKDLITVDLNKALNTVDPLLSTDVITLAVITTPMVAIN